MSKPGTGQSLQSAAKLPALGGVKVQVSLSMDQDIYAWLVGFVERGSNAFLPTVDDALTMAVRAMMEPDHPKALDGETYKELIEYTRAAKTDALTVMT